MDKIPALKTGTCGRMRKGYTDTTRREISTAAWILGGQDKWMRL